MSEAPALEPKRCKKCGFPGLVMKAGSNRWWVECEKFGRNGNCKAISDQASTRKAAIQNWNANCA
ncbi:hypothetical protein [Chitinimonas sp. BJYL2]|uniref:hypothetical protein n=1 Tax=Chitinimonas sp. BJYL2 TaxID=2976696 RepID=UPI0022B3348B|nr:hypothetical protein [Chitinimonas sp. BJYL2]